ncbi:hypothetical protein LTR85_007709 [Meristemomyces frigidus]|nr:hypothetical protein LTR85_007709 [Meristemomyces frigidus]
MPEQLVDGYGSAPYTIEEVADAAVPNYGASSSSNSALPPQPHHQLDKASELGRTGKRITSKYKELVMPVHHYYVDQRD